MDDFSLIDTLIKVDTSKRVAQIDITLEIKDYTGTVKLTDLMLQGGPISTIWTGHPSEARWSHDW